VCAASQTERMKKVVCYSDGPLVSSDIIGDPHSAIFDSPLTQLISDRCVRTITWYDNEWGYSNRVVDLLELMDKIGDG
jgi:glyceraldehyde 3-phosphate dehydrogenase